jgi:hypothetical protein
VDVSLDEKIVELTYNSKVKASISISDLFLHSKNTHNEKHKHSNISSMDLMHNYYDHLLNLK